MAKKTCHCICGESLTLTGSIEGVRVGVNLWHKGHQSEGHRLCSAQEQRVAKRQAVDTAKEQALCDAWNAAHPVGTKVTVEMDSSEIRETVTRSEAQVLQGRTAVIWLVGVVGCYALYRVTAIESESVNG